MKKLKVRYCIAGDGTILKEVRYPWYKRIFKNKWDQYENTNTWVPKKSYSESETKKVSRLTYHNNILSEEDVVIIVNAIRPNTFKESFNEINSGKYYIDVKTKGSINLLIACK